MSSHSDRNFIPERVLEHIGNDTFAMSLYFDLTEEYGTLCCFDHDGHYTYAFTGDHTDDGPFIVTFYIEDGDLNVDHNIVYRVNLGESISSSYIEFRERFGFEK